MRFSTFPLVALCLAGLLVSESARPWGEDGHRIVGQEALSLLDVRAADAVREILAHGPASSMDEACNWPDNVRKTRQWEWSAPLHFVNIPRTSQRYDRQRDCADGMCVTEGIVKYANELTRSDLDTTRRWQALAWVCHLVGDLHQPLHAGYEDDRGGNYVQIEYRGEEANLHQFWDRVVIRERLGPGDSWDKPLADDEWNTTLNRWNPAETETWTDESHALTARFAYPPARLIDVEFADQTWWVIRQQWQKSSIRLANILNAVLGEGEVIQD